MRGGWWSGRAPWRRGLLSWARKEGWRYGGPGCSQGASLGPGVWGLLTGAVAGIRPGRCPGHRPPQLWTPTPHCLWGSHPRAWVSALRRYSGGGGREHRSVPHGARATPAPSLSEPRPAVSPSDQAWDEPPTMPGPAGHGEGAGPGARSLQFVLGQAPEARALSEGTLCTCLAEKVGRRGQPRPQEAARVLTAPPGAPTGRPGLPSRCARVCPGRRPGRRAPRAV